MLMILLGGRLDGLSKPGTHDRRFSDKLHHIVLAQDTTPFIAAENKLYATHFFTRPALLNLQF